MTQKNRKFIEKAVSVSSSIIVCGWALIMLLVGVWFLLLVGSGMYVIPATWRIASAHYIKLAGLILCAITGFFFVLWITLKVIFKINEDFELREQAPSPLINVTTKQEKAIIRLLQRVATRSDGSDKIMKNYLILFLNKNLNDKIFDFFTI